MKQSVSSCDFAVNRKFLVIGMLDLVPQESHESKYLGCFYRWPQKRRSNTGNRITVKECIAKCREISAPVAGLMVSILFLIFYFKYIFKG